MPRKPGKNRWAFGRGAGAAYWRKLRRRKAKNIAKAKAREAETGEVKVKQWRTYWLGWTPTFGVAMLVRNKGKSKDKEPDVFGSGYMTCPECKCKMHIHVAGWRGNDAKAKVPTLRMLFSRWTRRERPFGKEDFAEMVGDNSRQKYRLKNKGLYK